MNKFKYTHFYENRNQRLCNLLIYFEISYFFLLLELYSDQ